MDKDRKSVSEEIITSRNINTERRIFLQRMLKVILPAFALAACQSGYPADVLATSTAEPVPSTISSSTLAPSAEEPILHASHVSLSIHIGSYSIDRNDLLEDEINSAVAAIAENIPGVDYIAIGTYLDYPEQIKMWLNSIHANGKKAYVRSAGFNSWQGTFGENATGSPLQHQEDVVTWIDNNYSIFQDGDIFEAVPDESANYYERRKDVYPVGVATSPETIDEFNMFLQNTTRLARGAFDRHGLQGVIVEVYHDNPSVIKNVITLETAQKFKILGTNNYPERNAHTPDEMANAMREELKRWVQPTHSETNKEITFGPSVYEQLDEETQRKALELELQAILETVPNLVGITIWQLGEESNWPTSRIFDYENNEWNSRLAIEPLNSLFK